MYRVIMLIALGFIMNGCKSVYEVNDYDKIIQAEKNAFDSINPIVERPRR